MIRIRVIEAESIMQSSGDDHDTAIPQIYDRMPTHDSNDNSFAKPMNVWDSGWE